MKFSLILFISILFTPFGMKALNEPQVRALPSQSDWFDAFSVVWWKSNNVPYTLQIVNPSLITVEMNMVEDVEILAINLTEYQLEENTPNYNNAQLVVTLADLQASTGSYYTLNIGKGAVNINVDGQPVPNDPVSYTFQLQSSASAQVPAPTISPAGGNVEFLESVTLSWKGFEVKRQTNGEGSFSQPVTMTVNGGTPQEITTSYVGEESESFWDHYSAININVNATENGEYVITIPADCLQLASDRTGTVYITDPIVLTYNVTGFESETTDYIKVKPSVNPADNYIGGPVGVVSVTWPGVRLVMDSEDKDIKTPINPSFVNITVNGNPFPINPDMTGGGRIWVKAQYESDGASAQWRVDDQLLIELPDMFFFWSGDIKIEIKEGAVTSLDGAVNAPINLNYTFINLDYDVTWNPTPDFEGPGVKFNSGDCIIYASWEGYDEISFNPNSFQKPFYQKETSENNGDHTTASEYMSIEDGKLKFDFSTLDAGVYILCIPSGTVILADGIMNGETTYNFAIEENPNTSAVNTFTESNSFIVFNMQGIKVMETSDASQLSVLPKGLYIVNGKKLLLN